MTAVLRPEVVEETLRSLVVCLRYSGKFRLIINIDPIGEVGYTQEIIEYVAKLYFANKNAVFVNMPKNAMHGRAVRWLLDQAKSEYILYWEDDYVLLDRINLDDHINVLSKRKKLGVIWFDRYDKPVDGRKGFSNMGYGYYLRTCRGGLMSTPALMKMSSIYLK